MLHGEIQGVTEQPKAAFCILEDAGAATSPTTSQQLWLSPRGSRVGSQGWFVMHSPESGMAQVPSLMLNPQEDSVPDAIPDDGLERTLLSR